jgi:hypothetical protein
MRCKIILQDGHQCGNPVWLRPILEGKFYDVCYAHRKLWKPPNYNVQRTAVESGKEITAEDEAPYFAEEHY